MTLEIIVATSLLVVIAGAATSLMTRASAASRHAIWMAAMLAILVMPAARAWLPVIELPVLSPSVASAGPQSATPQVPAVALSRSAVEPVAPIESSRPAITLAQMASAVWIVGLFAISIWYAAGTIGVWRLSRRSMFGAVDIQERAARQALLAGITRRVRVRVSADDRVPMTWGLLRPTILLPATSSNWPADRLDAVLAHELAHAARFDVVAHRIARIATALYWFNPLVWLAMRQAQLERERACDDLVLSQGSLASTYADELVQFARSLAAPAAALPMARRSRLEARVMAILDPRTNRKGISIGAAMLASAIIAGTVTASAIKLTRYDFPAPPERITFGAEKVPPPPPPPPPPPYVDLSGSWTAINPEIAGLANRYFNEGLSNAPATFTIAQDRQNLAFVRRFKQRDLVSVYPVNGFSFRNVLSRVHGTDSGAAHWQADSLVVSFSRGDFLVFRLDGDQLHVDQTGMPPLLYKRTVPATSQEGPVRQNLPPPPPPAPAQAQIPPVPPPPPPMLRSTDAQLRAIRCQQERDAAAAAGWDVTNLSFFCDPQLKAPHRIYESKPQYTPEAMRQKIQGTVELEGIVDLDGRVHESRVTRSLDQIYGLDEQAVKAFEAMRFEPATRNGVPVRVVVMIEMQFKLR